MSQLCILSVGNCSTVMVLCRWNTCPLRIEVWRQAQAITVHLQTAGCMQVNKASLSLWYSPGLGHGERGKSKSEPWRWSVSKPEANVGCTILVWCGPTCETESEMSEIRFDGEPYCLVLETEPGSCTVDNICWCCHHPGTDTGQFV